MTTVEIAAWIFLALLSVLMLFQLALVVGASWGSLAMGGRFPGRLPPAMRVAAVVQIVIYGVIGVVIASCAGIDLPEWREVSRVAVWAVVALMAPNFRSYAQAPLGLFWGLFAGFCWAIGTFVVKRTTWPGMGLSLTFWQVLLTFPPIALGALLIDGLPTHWPSAKALAATLYTGSIPMALGTATWFALVKLLPAQVAALSSIAIPIVAIVSGILILNEPLSTLQAVAIASTVISLWLALTPGRER